VVLNGQNRNRNSSWKYARRFAVATGAKYRF
jgi:hypothetical protein